MTELIQLMVAGSYQRCPKICEVAIIVVGNIHIFPLVSTVSSNNVQNTDIIMDSKKNYTVTRLTLLNDHFQFKILK